MITRGYLIGEIVDALSGLASQVEARCALGLTDLNKYVEDFFKSILNTALGLNLVNTNIERSNAPGLDLVDVGAGVGFQVTSQKSSAKVNETLKRVKDLPERPEEVFVLVVGKRQNKYTLDEDLCEELAFDETRVWDMVDLAQRVMPLQLDVLQSVHELVRTELARVSVELEIPNEQGDYPTSMAKYIEQLPKPTVTNFDAFFAFLVGQEESYVDHLAQIDDDLRAVVGRLAELPRITRDFYAFLLARRDDADPDQWGNLSFDYDRLKRICSYPDIAGELRLLESEKLASLRRPDENEEFSPYVCIHGQGESGYLVLEVIQFIKETGGDFSRPIVHLDFSAFAG